MGSVNRHTKNEMEYAHAHVVETVKKHFISELYKK
jgi:hypothetical protein